MINRERVVQTFCDLSRIDSPSGEEETIAQELTRRLQGLGFKVVRDDYGNLIAKEGGESPIILSAHMDTVEPGRGVKPRVENDRIVADGNTIVGGDCKAGIAAILEALTSIKEDEAAHRPVEVVFTREEETGLIGARNLDFSRITGKEAIVFDAEGTASRITSASPTYVSFDIEITGRAAHAGVEPEKGISAIRIAAELVCSLPQGRLDPQTTFNVGRMQGGSVRNAVPEKAQITGEFRSINLETLSKVRQQVAEEVNKVRQKYPEATIDDRIRIEFEAYTLSEDDPATQKVTEVLQGMGMKPEMKPSGGGSDGNIFRQHGISAVVVGMADHAMHTVREYVSIPDLVNVARLCEALVRTTR